MEITVGEFLDALRKNGYKWIKGDFINRDGASCAMGQAMRNLNLNPRDENLGFNISRILRSKCNMPYGIIYANDNMATSYEDVVEYAEKYLVGHEDENIFEGAIF